jgi:hypothetical protein
MEHTTGTRLCSSIRIARNWQAAKQWLLYAWSNIQIQGSFIQQHNTLRRGTVFWPSCTHATRYMWMVTALQLGGLWTTLQIGLISRPGNSISRSNWLAGNLRQITSWSTSCHVLASDTWHQFLFYQHTNFGASDIHRTVHRDTFL